MAGIAGNVLRAAHIDGWSIATKVAAALAIVVVLSVAVTALAGWRKTDAKILEVELDEANKRLADNIRVARAIFDARFPGPWHVVPAPPLAAPLAIYNGNGRRDEYKSTETLTELLYKGTTRILGNAEVERVLLEIDSLTGTELTIAQRIAPATSLDATVGAAPEGRALRLVTTVTRAGADGVQRRATLTVMPALNVATGRAAGAGAVFQSGRTYAGRAMVAGRDSWTHYAPLDADGSTIGIFYGGIAFQPFADRARHASASVARHVLLLGLLSALTACLLLFVLTRRLLHPLSVIRDAAIRIARGDLGARAAMTRGDEIGELARVFDAMAEQLHTLLEHIRVATEQLTASSSEADATTATAAHATQQVAQSVGEVALGAGETSKRVEDVGRQAGEALSQIAAIQREVRSALAEAKEADSLASAGHAEAARSFSVSDGIRLTVSRAMSVMADLERQAKEIGSIVEMIKTIAAQTNLLALNAAIEAARAGDSGRGFAVVAAEIRTLADEARKSSDDIAERLHATRERASDAVKLMDVVERETLAGVEAARTSDEAFASITRAVSRLTAQVTSIHDAANGVTEAVRQVNATIEGVASIAEESAAASEEVSALAEEQSRALEEITREIHAVSSMAENLRAIVARKGVVGEESDSLPALVPGADVLAQAPMRDVA